MAIEQYGRCPCDDGWISQGYKSNHKAIDIGWLKDFGKNRPVKAWKSGVVVATGTDSAGGVYVVLQHDDGSARWISRYWHFVKGSLKVKKGQSVKQGDILGTRGNTGISTGVHLHFELWKCPVNYKYSSSGYSKYAKNPLDYTYVFDGQTISGDMEKKPDEVVQPEPVAADETKHQVEVIASKLRVRTLPSLNASVYCFSKKGIFNVLEEITADGYRWFKIESDRWIATKEGSWTIDKPSNVETIDSLKSTINELNSDITMLENKLKAIQQVINS